PPTAPVQSMPVQTVAASTSPQNSVAVPGVMPGSTPVQKPAKREPKTLFSLIRGNTNETTIPAQPFHHPMEQYQHPTNGLPPVNTTPGGR
ncbi:MAG TPA: hypothetical protein PKD72_15575, partial [Gemmatales bacterium]|nr:hypothetical protein [Gemmatales bacterium]